jgi:magnesium chelatase family protein
VSATVVTVEVDVARGLPSVGIVGLPQASVAESRWRVRSAVENARLDWPGSRITIGLSPADLPKSGTSLDLAIAVAVLRATGQVPEISRELDGSALFIGELGLDGTVKPVRGAIAAALAALREGLDTVVAPVGNAADLEHLPGIDPVYIRDLGHLARILRDEDQGCEVPRSDQRTARMNEPDFADVRGHEHARYALEVAAAGGHHCSMVGPPGSGKTMLASRLVSILPDLQEDLCLEVTSIQALAGQVPVAAGLVRRPPFIAPHHSSSAASILGTFRGAQPVPGAVTLAHGGVLFLDEAPEFNRAALEGLRQPLEASTVSIMRAGSAAVLPAHFQVILASNPCPCGMGVGRGDRCRCSSMIRRRYAAKLSGPLLDRIDIRLSVNKPTVGELAMSSGESSSAIAQRVLKAREAARRRFADMPWTVNAQIPSGELRRRWSPDVAGQRLLEQAAGASISLRGLDRVLRVAWTVADLAGIPRPGADQVAIALGLRAEDPAGVDRDA